MKAREMTELTRGEEGQGSSSAEMDQQPINSDPETSFLPVTIANKARNLNLKLLLVRVCANV